jgi:hypothetical protein
MPRSLVDCYQRFVGMYRLHLHLYPENGDNTFPQNVDSYTGSWRRYVPPKHWDCVQDYSTEDDDRHTLNLFLKVTLSLN